jgi:hypothetical protein
MRSLFEFLQEPYEAACLEPLQNRINSSTVPANFQRQIRRQIALKSMRRGRWRTNW